ncbi:MAG: hypothetical protein QNJ97_29155 [Myxococcota bacterium]|nr:hypothetical protein [Myxococcota bacterium]
MKTHSVLIVTAVMVVSACATLQQIAALRHVDFSIDRVSGIELVGINASQVRSYSDLGLADAARVGAAIARRELPVSFRLHLTAENPRDNSVSARLTQMQWTLLLEDTETISGSIGREYVIPPGQPVDIPLTIQLDLFEFFDRSGPELVDLALNLTGLGGSPTRITIRATPTINTSLGPISYPQPITIVSRRVGR